jgi:hypothetical protein
MSIDEDELVRREAARHGLSETQYRMLKVAGTDVVQSIVQDHVGRASVTTPSSMASTPGSASAPERGTGWRDAKPLGPQRDIGLIDQMVENQTQMERLQAALEALDADAAIRRARERKE